MPTHICLNLHQYHIIHPRTHSLERKIYITKPPFKTTLHINNVTMIVVEASETSQAIILRFVLLLQLLVRQTQLA